MPVFMQLSCKDEIWLLLEGAKTFAAPYTSLSVYLGSCLLHGNTISNVFTALPFIFILETIKDHWRNHQHQSFKANMSVMKVN